MCQGLFARGAVLLVVVDPKYEKAGPSSNKVRRGSERVGPCGARGGRRARTKKVFLQHFVKAPFLGAVTPRIFRDGRYILC